MLASSLLPAHLPSWALLLILLLVLALDILLVLSAIALGVLFTAFKAGKLAYDAIDRLVDRLIYTVLCLLEDVLESPPLDTVPFFQLVLVGVKKAYDLLNGAQKLVEFAVNAAVTAFAVLFMLALVLGLAVINLVALGLLLSYAA